MNNIRIFVFSLLLLPTFCSAAEESDMEKTYRQLAARFEQRDKSLQPELKNYLRTYPYTTFESEIHFMGGVLLAERTRWKQAEKELAQVEPKALTRPHADEYLFYRGYTHLMQQQYSAAAGCFSQLKKTENAYTQKAIYYYGYTQYKMGKWDKALPSFQALENDPAYAETVPYFLLQTYYALGEYDEVRSRAELILQKQPNNKNNGEVYRMLGELAYQQSDYETAVRYLKLYEKSPKEEGEKIVRNDLYQLGIASYRLGQYKDAAQYLKKVQPERDSISESACMTLGHAYRALGETEKAKLSYQAAADYALTPAVREEALYNYTLCTYESSSALGESVTAFTDYLREYPNGKYEENVQHLLSDAFLQSKNYKAALRTLDSIATITPQLKATKQYLRYQLGADAFLQGKMNDSRYWMNEVILHSAECNDYSTEAYFLRAEAAYRLRDYNAAAADLNSFMARQDARRSPNYKQAVYLNGYTQFSMQKYEAARTAFRKYIDITDNADPTYADALNRIGDCAFSSRDFATAIACYGQVIELSGAGADYATFQKGYAQGLRREYNNKISTLRSLITNYPKSDYADDGLYEIARAQLQLEQEANAITTYDQLLTQYPQSTHARKASLEKAMLYRNLHQNNEAIAAYKSTIERWPATDEAYTALTELEAVYVEEGNVSDYLAFTKTLQKMNMQITTADDSLSYAAAELQYMRGEYSRAAVALTNYRNQFCSGGRWCTTAQYFLADSYYRLGQMNNALTEYKRLADIASNPYMEEACTRVAGISYDNKDYATSMDYFYRMLSVASTQEQRDIARLGILRCAYQLDRYPSTIDIATQILNESENNSDNRKEALFCRAKAYVAQGQWTAAIADLTPLAEEVRTAAGAESKYLLAEAYYQLHDLDGAEAQIMSFTRMNTQQQYWLARALVLLSDINAARGEDFQARQYLLTLQQNYHGQDDIADMVTQRLTALDAKVNDNANDNANDNDNED